jgi:hypothetical protein
MNFRRVLGIVIASATAMVVATAVLALRVLVAAIWWWRRAGEPVGNLGRRTRMSVASAPAARD